MGKARNTIFAVLAVCAVCLITYAQQQDVKTRSILVSSSDTYPAFRSVKPNQGSSGNNWIELNDGTNIVFFVNSAGGLGLTILNTNVIGGSLYTNSSGKNQQITAMAYYTKAAVAGYAGVNLIVTNLTSTNTVVIGQNTTTSSVVESITNLLQTFIPPGAVWYFSNNVSGSGNAAGITGGQLITY